jgi:prophage maintenance system killer protein
MLLAYERAGILRLAAADAHALTQNHPFADGNKRVALRWRVCSSN